MLDIFLFQAKGNHAMQRVLQKCLPQCSKFIFHANYNLVDDVARHMNGCCVTSSDNVIDAKIN